VGLADTLIESAPEGGEPQGSSALLTRTGEGIVSLS